MTPETPATTTRRQFQRDLAVAAGAAFGLPAARAKAEEKTPVKGDELFAIIEARYGKHLQPEQLAEIKKALRRDQTRGEYLKRFTLKNSDEPAFVFRADI